MVWNALVVDYLDTTRENLQGVTIHHLTKNLTTHMASQSKILICYGFCSNREEIPRKKTDKPALGIVQMAKTVEKEEELVNQCFTTKAKIEPPQELTSLDEAT